MTKKTIPQEARPATWSYSLVKAIRKRRLKWVKEILRAGPTRLTYQAIEEQHRMTLPGNLLVDAPPYTTLEELAIVAKDQIQWKVLVNSIPWYDRPMIYLKYIVNFEGSNNTNSMKEKKNENYFRKFNVYLV